MNRRRTFWLVCTFVVLVFLFFGIPLHIYQARAFLISTVGAAAFFICGFQFLWDFESFNKIKLSSSLEKKTIPKETRLFSTMVFPALILLFVLLFYHEDKKVKVLKSEGAVSKGVVVYKEAISTSSIRHGTRTTYNVSVRYSDLSGKKYFISESVGEKKYKWVYEGAVVDVVYSQDYPQMAEILIGDEDLKKYLTIPTGDLAIEHLLSILGGTRPKDSVLNDLNRINYKWTLKDSGTVYTNERLEMLIKVGSGGLVYEQRSPATSRKDKDNIAAQFDFEKDLIRKGFTENATQGVNTSMAFYNDKYTINKGTKTKEDLLKPGDVASTKYYNVYYIRKISE